MLKYFLIAPTLGALISASPVQAQIAPLNSECHIRYQSGVERDLSSICDWSQKAQNQQSTLVPVQSTAVQPLNKAKKSVVTVQVRSNGQLYFTVRGRETTEQGIILK